MPQNFSYGVTADIVRGKDGKDYKVDPEQSSNTFDNLKYLEPDQVIVINNDNKAFYTADLVSNNPHFTLDGNQITTTTPNQDKQITIENIPNEVLEEYGIEIKRTVVNGVEETKIDMLNFDEGRFIEQTFRNNGGNWEVTTHDIGEEIRETLDKIGAGAEGEKLVSQLRDYFEESEVTTSIIAARHLADKTEDYGIDAQQAADIVSDKFSKIISDGISDPKAKLGEDFAKQFIGMQQVSAAFTRHHENDATHPPKMQFDVNVDHDELGKVKIGELNLNTSADLNTYFAKELAFDDNTFHKHLVEHISQTTGKSQYQVSIEHSEQVWNAFDDISERVDQAREVLSEHNVIHPNHEKRNIFWDLDAKIAVLDHKNGNEFKMFEPKYAGSYENFMQEIAASQGGKPLSDDYEFKLISDYPGINAGGLVEKLIAEKGLTSGDDSIKDLWRKSTRQTIVSLTDDPQVKNFETQAMLDSLDANFGKLSYVPIREFYSQEDLDLISPKGRNTLVNEPEPPTPAPTMAQQNEMTMSPF